MSNSPGRMLYTNRDAYKPYIRLGKFNEKATSMREAMRLAYYRERKRETGREYWVMLQRGVTPPLVLAVGSKKSDLKRSPVQVWVGRKTFNQWANDTKRHAQGKRAPRKR